MRVRGTMLRYSLAKGAALLVLQVLPEGTGFVAVHVHLLEQVKVGVLLLGEADDVVGRAGFLHQTNVNCCIIII